MADAEATREHCPEWLQAASSGRSWCSADRSVWGAGDGLDQHHRDHAQRHLRWKVPRDLIFTYKPFPINSYKVSPPFCIIHVLFDIPSFPYPIVWNLKLIMPFFCNHICFQIYFLFEFCGKMFSWVNILACIYVFIGPYPASINHVIEIIQLISPFKICSWILGLLMP